MRLIRNTKSRRMKNDILFWILFSLSLSVCICVYLLCIFLFSFFLYLNDFYFSDRSDRSSEKNSALWKEQVELLLVVTFLCSFIHRNKMKFERNKRTKWNRVCVVTSSSRKCTIIINFVVFFVFTNFQVHPMDSTFQFAHFTHFHYSAPFNIKRGWQREKETEWAQNCQNRSQHDCT